MTLDAERQAGALMRLAQAGDQSAYASLLTMLASIIRAFVLARTGAVPWVDDVVQNTLIAIHRSRHTYDAGRPFAPWFYAIASSRLIDTLRREKRIALREVGVDRFPESATSGPQSPASLDPDAIRAAVAALPGRQREIVCGLKFEDRSIREVASHLGMSPSAVKVAAHRAYKSLRQMLRSARRED